MPHSPSTSWGAVAGWYDNHLTDPDSYHEQVVWPHLRRLVAPAPGVKILDVACGQGFFSRKLAAEGASVVGADLAPELVDIAAKRAQAEGLSERCRFFVRASHLLGEVPEAPFDHAICVLALQNINDVRGTLAAIAPLVRTGGTLHLVINHPSFRVPKASGWGWDPSADIQFRRVDRYLSEAKTVIAMHPGADPSAMTYSYHRPLQYYVKALSRAGFAVTNCEEWASHRTSDSGPRAVGENVARKEFPLFMYLAAERR
jgi:ubiquinone/menaquinone biosynthesis C-methylase UbiE